MAKNNYSCLSDMTEGFTDGYLIVGDTLFEVSDSKVEDYWELDSETLADKVKESREVAELSEEEEIFFDDEKCYDEIYLQEEGELGSYLDKKLTEDEESFLEYATDHY